MSITPSLVASRTSGVAPLFVHVDATATVSTAENTQTKAFRNLDYRWTFGDPAGGALWGYGAQNNLSKNVASGPVAAHVFETPGTYTITLIISDGGISTPTTTTVDITVTDPDTVTALSGANVIAVAQDGDFTGAPAGSTHVTTGDQVTALANISATKHKLLFKRGNTFTTTGEYDATLAGPIIVGAWGSGAKPRLNYTKTGGIADQLFRVGGTSFTDWRFVDLDINGTGSNSAGCFVGTSKASRVLLLRVDISTFEFNGVSLDELNAAANDWFTEWGIVDCTISATGAYAAYFGAEKSAFLGSSIDVPTGGIGAWRSQHFTRCIFSSCTAKQSSSNFHLLKFGGTEFNGAQDPFYAGVYSELFVISDNYFDDRAGAGGWMIAIGPQNAGVDERLRDILFERNWCRRPGLIAVKLWCSKTTVRNNIIDLSSSGDGTFDITAGIHVDQRGLEPVPDDVTIVNNTTYRSDGGYPGPNVYSSVKLSLGTNMVVKNNIGYTPNITGSLSVMLTDNATATSKSNNSTDAQQRATSPSFASATPTGPSDFQILTGSYAKDAGASLSVFGDFFGNSRPQGASYDMGFHEFSISVAGQALNLALGWRLGR